MSTKVFTTARIAGNASTPRGYRWSSFALDSATLSRFAKYARDVSVDMLMAVTNREIAAGRMTEDHSLRKIAVEGAAAPDLSHAELLAKHAKLKQDAAMSTATPSPQTFAQKLKGLFRK